MPIAHKGHTASEFTSDDWITPKHVIAAVGPFDLDPCACRKQPWPCAEKVYVSGGLDKP